MTSNLMSPCFAFVLYSGIVRHAHCWSCLPLLTKKGRGYKKKKREKGICCVADEEKGSPHVLLCLGLENRVFSNKHVKHPHILLK